MMVISPYSKKNYLSHATADYTAILKLIEKRFNLSPLTARDAAQIDMDTEFFDFSAPWLSSAGGILDTSSTGYHALLHGPSALS